MRCKAGDSGWAQTFRHRSLRCMIGALGLQRQADYANLLTKPVAFHFTKISQLHRPHTCAQAAKNATALRTYSVGVGVGNCRCCPALAA